ncbi:hypothetical protein BST30_06025 [Mycobacterium mantenii]|nr:hypothetical protein BST30_06025 [Mycobacterium mantenii]
MAQARLLVIFKVEMPGGLESLATFRVENRSKDLFFDVTVPYVDSPDNSAAGFERRTPELVEAGNRLHEFLPSGELLTPYRSNTEHEAWFTLVTVHTANWRDIKFAVEYTDAGGRRWRQHLGGQIEPIFTAEAIPIREADRFQPSQQIRRLTPVEARRLGGQFARDLPPLESDEEYLEVLEPIRVARWSRIQRVGNITERTPSDSTGQPQTAVTFTPAAPPFWEDHFRAKVGEAGITIGGGQSDGRSQSIYLRLPDEHPPAATVELIDAAIQYANDLFEANELAAARRALQARRGGHT